MLLTKRITDNGQRTTDNEQRMTTNGLPDTLSPMDLNRRDYLLLQGAALAGWTFAAEPSNSWTQKIRRVGQTNMTEHDPVELNVERWADSGPA